MQDQEIWDGAEEALSFYDPSQTDAVRNDPSHPRHETTNKRRIELAMQGLANYIFVRATTSLKTSKEEIDLARYLFEPHIWDRAAHGLEYKDAMKLTAMALVGHLTALAIENDRFQYLPDALGLLCEYIDGVAGFSSETIGIASGSLRINGGNGVYRLISFKDKEGGGGGGGRKATMMPVPTPNGTQTVFR